MNSQEEGVKRKPVDHFMDVITDHMDLGHEEKQLLHEEAHNIYNKAFIDGQEYKLQSIADEVGAIVAVSDGYCDEKEFKQDVLEIINKNRQQ